MVFAIKSLSKQTSDILQFESIIQKFSSTRASLESEFVLFIRGKRALILSVVVSRPQLLSYIFSIHLCNEHFVAIQRKTGIIKCLYILNDE